MRDFRLFTRVVADLEGGAYINLGSPVAIGNPGLGDLPLFVLLSGDLLLALGLGRLVFGLPLRGNLRAA